jgi:hypothetical protein
MDLLEFYLAEEFLHGAQRALEETATRFGLSQDEVRRLVAESEVTA